MTPAAVGALAALGVLVVGGGGLYLAKRAAPRPTPLQPGEQVLLLGDSLGVGMGAALAAALPSTATIDREAHVGWTARQVRTAFEADPAIFGHIVVLSLGSNDAAMVDPSVEAADVASLLATARARGARRIVWVVPPNFSLASPPGPATTDKQRAFRALLEADPAVEILQPSATVIARLGPDHIHLPPSGYQALAAEVAGALS